MTLRTQVVVGAALVFALAAGALGQYGQASQVTEENIRQAVDKAAEFLFTLRNKQGLWDPPNPPKGYALDPKLTSHLAYIWGGRTALALHALAAAGKREDPRFKPALDWLMKQPLLSTYSTSARVQLIHALPQDPALRKVLMRDAQLLVKGVRWDSGRVMWNYYPPPGRGRPHLGDYSNINYAVLGLWAAGDEGFEVNTRIWRGLEQSYVTDQHANGGWSYQPVRPGFVGGQVVSGSMTTAAIASLYLVIDQTYARTGGPGAFRNTAAYKSIQSGLKWMESNFQGASNPGRAGFWETYYFYNCERVAAAAGLKYFGNHDWFVEIAAHLLSCQAASGAFQLHGNRPNEDIPLVNTAFGVLFLTKGAAPVVANKLQHAGDWDNHLRDLAVLSDWMARQLERPATWQVVSLEVPAEELTDSRILYIAGTAVLNFTDEQRDKLKRFVELGGLLVLHPDSPDPAFRGSAAALLQKMWGELELSRVDLDTHLLGSIYMPIRDKSVWLEQLASPTRVLAFVVHGVPAGAWSRRQHLLHKDAFALGADLHLFANDKAPRDQFPTRLSRFAGVFSRPAAATARSIALARIKYGRNPLLWDPEPLAFERFSRLLAEREGVECRVQLVTPDQLASCGAKIAHLTGSDATAFASAAELDAIAAWVKAGGTLIVDRAGGFGKPGSETFDPAFRKFVDSRFGGDALRLLRSSDPLLVGLGDQPHRHVMGEYRNTIPARLEVVRVGDWRPGIIYSPYDLTCGLLGNPNPMVAGAEGDGAYRILWHLLRKIEGGGDKGGQTAPPAG